MCRACVLALLVSLFGVAGARAEDAEYSPPKDGVFTEKQVNNYIGAMKDIVQYWRAAGKAVENSKSGAATLALLATNDEKMNSIRTQHGLSRGEWEWLGNKVTEARVAAMQEEMMEKASTELSANAKENEKKLSDLRQKQATYAKAQKDGKRVLSPEERESLSKSAKDEQESALQEAKEHADAAKTAADEAKKADDEAKAAEALAKKPPADVADDDKASYIDGKKQEAEAARTAAKEARDRQAESKKSEAEARAKADAAASRAKNPDVPTTDEEKEQVKKQNSDMVDQLNSEIETTDQAIKLAAEFQTTYRKSLDKDKIQAPAQNVALLRKHLKEYDEIWQEKKPVKK